MNVKYIFFGVGIIAFFLVIGLLSRKKTISDMEELRSISLPVLCYHRFGKPVPGDSYLLDTMVFQQQMKWLKSEGWQSVTLDQIWKAYIQGEVLPEKAFCLTMDDGYRSVLTQAFPVLKELGFTAVVFAISNQIGISRSFMDWPDLKFLKSSGWDIASHSASHSNLGKIQKNESCVQYRQRLNREILGSRENLEKKLGFQVEYLAYPYGAYNPGVMKVVSGAGYKMAFTVTEGVNHQKENLFAFHRIMFAGQPGLKSFVQRITRSALEPQIYGFQEGEAFSVSGLPSDLRLLNASGVSNLKLRIDKKLLEFSASQTDRSVWDFPVDLKPGFHLMHFEGTVDKKMWKRDLIFQVYNQQQADCTTLGMVRK